MDNTLQDVAKYERTHLWQLIHTSLLNYPVTHLHVSSSDIGTPEHLTQIVKDDCLQSLSHLSIIDCRGVKGNLGFLFVYVKPSLEHLSLLWTNLSEADLRTLSFACNGENKTLPNLTSLSLTIPNDIRTQSVTENLFALPFLNLKGLYVHYSQTHHVDMDQALRDTLLANKLPNLQCLGIQIKIEGTNIYPGVFRLIVAPYVQSVILCNCVLHHESSFFPMELCKAEFRSCEGLSTYLLKLMQQGFLSLHTLGLTRCDLGAQALSCVAQACMEGRLPELKVLDINRNKITGSEVMHLFAHSCTWSQLLGLDISKNLLDKTDGTYFMVRVKTDGLLCHLQQLGIDIYTNVGTLWPSLRFLYLPWCATETLGLIKNDICADLFPALRTICVGQFEMYDGFVISNMSERKIHCHKTFVPFEDPFSSVKCYCQLK